MSLPLLSLGILGSLVLTVGAALPEASSKKVASYKVPKNLILSLGNLMIITYAILNYLISDASPLYVFLEGLILLATIFMLLDIPDRVEIPAVIIATLAALGLSFWWSQDLSVWWFVLGLGGVSLGFILPPTGSIRSIAFTVGSGFICIFSFLHSDWVFFGLNLAFALVSVWRWRKSR